MKLNGWNRFTLKVPVNADVEQLYHAWSTRAGLEQWFLREALFKKKDNTLFAENEPAARGATYEWRWHGYTDDIEETKQVTEANGIDFFQFLFTCNCLVSVTIKKINSGTCMVELTQENIPDDSNAATNLYVQCQLGWTFYLANLKSVLEGGIDLRNKDEKLGRVINA